MKQPSVSVDEEEVRECANDLRPLLPTQKAYCSTLCKLTVKLWRAKIEADARRKRKVGS